MFPIVPQNFELKNYSFTNPELITSFHTGSSKLLVPGKVTASSAIAAGSVTEAFEAKCLTGQTEIVQISVKANTMSFIELEENSKKMWNKETHWVRAIRLSEDCHSYNVLLRFEKNYATETSVNKNFSTKKLILETVKSIDLGQELLLWFSEDILALLQVAFLAPANIQGQKKYVCTKCSALYESPNPLKLHIFLGCGCNSIALLWDRLYKTLNESNFSSPLRQNNFDFKLSPEPQINRQRNAMDLSIPNFNSNDDQESGEKNLYRPYSSEASAFKPFRKQTDTQVRESLFVPYMGNIQIWPLASFEPQNLHLQQRVNEEEANIESLVSSLGKSKQGHICLYCGKCYSRKYGLKIHIRTHTGYKPLKCKFCMRPFGDPSNLNKHVRLHAEGNTPYKCDLCGKILVRRRDLDRHLKSRHMRELHPGLNILQDDSNIEDVDDVKSEGEMSNS